MEAMEERQVTSLGVCRELEDPFIVLATQNPIEQEGTYPLPMAQYDRFLFKVHLGYPSWEEEERIARLTALGREDRLDPVVSRAEFIEIADAIRQRRRADVPHALRRRARPGLPTRAPGAPGSVREYVEWGAGPRAAQALIHGARARAFLRGRSVPNVEDVRAIVPAVLRHRLVLSYAAEADAVHADTVARDLLEQVPCPGLDTRQRRPSWLRRVFEASGRLGTQIGLMSRQGRDTSLPAEWRTRPIRAAGANAGPSWRGPERSRSTTSSPRG